jgi:hypothetical protein
VATALVISPITYYESMYMLKSLKFYSTLGWALFPCSSKNKAPITPHGFKDATTDYQQIVEWYWKYPNCAWGTPTSAERGVIDIDPRNGGIETLAGLWELPETPTVKTGGDGFHYYLEFPIGTPSGIVAPGIDRKAEGGYVIVPPSRIDIPEHGGRAYAWDVPEWYVMPIAKAPSWCLASVSKPKASTPTEADTPFMVKPKPLNLLTHPGAPEGERRLTLCKLVGVHLSRGDSEPSIMDLAEAWAGRCQPLFNEWRKHVDGILANDGGKKKLAFFLPTMNETPLAVASADSSFPTLPPEAYHGLLGEMLRAIEPETEADPAAVLLGFLTCFGSIVGRGAWVRVGPRLHHPALFVGMGGKSSSGAKGDGWAASLFPFREVYPAWAKGCVVNGIGSGEGLIELVADAQSILDKDGVAQVIPGAADKRRLLRLSELSTCFKHGRRENATLSEHLREAWDGEPMQIPNRKSNGLSASDYAISLVGDITPEMLERLMGGGGTEGFDGWANRFLWAKVKRSRFLDEGGNIDVLKPFLNRLQSALSFAKTAGEVKKDDEAKVLWKKVYPALATSGDDVPHTDRARPQALRLAMIYALADCSAVIRLDHLQAALGAWEYCRESAKLLFPVVAQAEPDPLWLQVSNAIARSPGVKRGDLTVAFKHKAKADELDKALAYLEAQGLAHRRTLQGGGRPAECWFPGGKPSGDGDGVEDYNLPSLSQNSGNSVNSPGRKVSKSDNETLKTGKEDLLTFLPSVPSEDENNLKLNLRVEEEVVKPSPQPSPPSHIAITEITPPPGTPLEANTDVALDADDFLAPLCHKEEGRLL